MKKILLLSLFLLSFDLTGQSCCTVLSRRVDSLERLVSNLVAVNVIYDAYFSDIFARLYELEYNQCNEAPFIQRIFGPFLPEQNEENLYLNSRLPAGCDQMKALVIMDDCVLYCQWMDSNDGWRIMYLSYGGQYYCPEN